MTKLFLTATISLFVLLAFQIESADANPFISQKPEKREVRLPAFANKFIGKIRLWQNNLHTRLTGQVKKFRDNRSFKTLFPLILVSFLYGMAHAAGPGHGKIVVFSYFLSREADIKKGILIGHLIGLLHAISGIIIVLSLYYIIKTAYLSSFDNISRYLQIISYTVVILIGISLLLNSLFNIADRLPGRFKNQVNLEKDSQGKSLLPVALTVGIVPCPGVVIVMLFALSFNLLAIGLAMSFIIAFGMAVTMALAGLISILGREVLLKKTTGKRHIQNFIEKSLQIIGPLIIILLGSILLAGVLPL